MKIKFFEKFKDQQPHIVVAGTAEAYSNASKFLSNKDEATLADKEITDWFNIYPLDRSILMLNKDECKELEQCFNGISKATLPSHVYFETKALGDIEIIISYLEYDKIFSEDDR